MFNALCETDVQYKPFHNQLSKPQFPILMREVRNGPRKLDSALSEIFLRFQATNLTLA